MWVKEGWDRGRARVNLAEEQKSSWIKAMESSTSSEVLSIHKH